MSLGSELVFVFSKVDGDPIGVCVYVSGPQDWVVECTQ